MRAAGDALVGSHAREAWFVTFHLHQACEVQLRAQAAGQTLSSAAGEIAIDPERCVDCGICSSVCPSGALSCSTPDWRLQFDQRRCVVCEQCIAVCPLDAISLKL